MSNVSRIAEAEQAVLEWQRLAAVAEAARAAVPMTQEEHDLGNLFAGVLPALRLHVEHQTPDCLACGNPLDMEALKERIQLCDAYVLQADASRSLDAVARRAEAAALAAEAYATKLMENIDAPEVDAAPLTETTSATGFYKTGLTRDEENSTMLSRNWTPDQISRLTENARRWIVKEGLSGQHHSVLKDGSLFDTKNGRALVYSLAGVKW